MSDAPKVTAPVWRPPLMQPYQRFCFARLARAEKAKAIRHALAPGLTRGMPGDLIGVDEFALQPAQPKGPTP